jgi:hypothetical protein
VHARPSRPQEDGALGLRPACASVGILDLARLTFSVGAIEISGAGFGQQASFVTGSFQGSHRIVCITVPGLLAARERLHHFAAVMLSEAELDDALLLAASSLPAPPLPRPAGAVHAVARKHHALYETANCALPDRLASNARGLAASGRLAAPRDHAGTNQRQANKRQGRRLGNALEVRDIQGQGVQREVVPRSAGDRHAQP